MTRRNIKTAARIVNRLHSDLIVGDRPADYFPAFHDAAGHQVFFGPFQAFRLSDDEELFQLTTENQVLPSDNAHIVKFLEKTFKELIDRKSQPLELPTITELKAAIKQQRAEGRKAHDNPPVWMFGHVTVNACYLLEALQMIPGAAYAGISGKSDPVLIWSENLDAVGFLLPRWR